MAMKFNEEIKRGTLQIGSNHPTYIIAEMACAHNGDLQQAKDLISASKEAGADACQLQFFVPEETVTPSHKVFSVLQDIAFSEAEWKELFDFGMNLGLDMWVCTYDKTSVEWAAKFGAVGIKLNSADLSNPDVLKAVAKSNIPFTLGTGASTMEEIRRGLVFLEEYGAEDCILMQGVQNFPTLNKDLHISRISLLINTFPGLSVGYADHTDGDDPYGNVIDLLAIGLGAVLLEKHITLDRSAKGIDYQAALEPDEFKKYVANMRRGKEAMGSSKELEFTESDLKYRKFQKKSIVAAQNMLAGQAISRQDVLFLRNEVPGIPPIVFSELEGKKLTTDILQYDNILPENLG
jgi:sialic acid synthase SpsE